MTREERMIESIQPRSEKNSKGSKLTNIASTDGGSSYEKEIKAMREEVQAMRDSVKRTEERRRPADYDAPSDNGGERMVSEQVDCFRATKFDFGWLTMGAPETKGPTCIVSSKKMYKAIYGNNPVLWNTEADRERVEEAIARRK